MRQELIAPGDLRDFTYRSLPTRRSHTRNAMDVRAAVAVAAGKPLEVTTGQREGPREGEVLVEIKATGVCHTDEFTLSGADPEGLFPASSAMKARASWSISARASPA
jgi:hypothetical protein